MEPLRIFFWSLNSSNLLCYALELTILGHLSQMPGEYFIYVNSGLLLLKSGFFFIIIALNIYSVPLFISPSSWNSVVHVLNLFCLLSFKWFFFQNILSFFFISFSLRLFFYFFQFPLLSFNLNLYFFSHLVLWILFFNILFSWRI